MTRSYLINKYLGIEFIKIVINASFIFFFLGCIMNLFEEINFFKDVDIGFKLPLILTFMYVPSLLSNFFPFIILISCIWFFLKIRKTDELTAINISGVSNVSIILIPCTLTIILGIFFVTSLSPLTSALVKKYESIKGTYETDQEYLAAITENGIWIKEKSLNKNSLIRATHLSEENLIEVSIYEFNGNNDFIRRLDADLANISTQKWILKNVNIISSNENNNLRNIKEVTYDSLYNLKKIKSLYSNLDTISFWDIENEIKLLEERGYSTKDMEVKLHKSFAFPFYLLSMVLLSAVFTLAANYKDNGWHYVFISIALSILIFFFNDFSAALGKTEKLPLEVSVWMPVAIIFIFSLIGLIHANQK
jgi:lipopolysaccharide export system permease protein